MGMRDERINKIERMIAEGRMTAAQVFTQMRQLLPPASATDAEPVDCLHCGGTGDVSGEYPGASCTACNGQGYTTPLAAGTGGLPEGYVLAPKSMCITQEDVGLIAMMTGWDEEDQDDAEGVLWFGLIEDDDGNRTHGLNISCAECMEEGAIQLVQFDEPSASPGDGWSVKSGHGIWEVTSPNGKPISVPVELEEFFSATFGGRS